MSERRFPPLPGETPQEWSRRVLTALDGPRDELPPPLPVHKKGCGYCGGRRMHGRSTCPAHADLPAIDPGLTPETKQEPAERFLPEVLLDRLSTRGA